MKELKRAGFKDNISHDKIVADAEAMTEKEVIIILEAMITKNGFTT